MNEFENASRKLLEGVGKVCSNNKHEENKM